MYETDEDDEWEEEDLDDDFVVVGDNALMTNAAQWDSIVHYLLRGYTIYHRYNLQGREDDEHTWITESITSRMNKEKVPLFSIDEIYEGEMWKYLNDFGDTDGGYIDPEDIYYSVWHVNPTNNKGALNLLKKDKLNIESMRRWLDEQRTVITASMGEDIGMD